MVRRGLAGLLLVTLGCSDGTAVPSDMTCTPDDPDGCAEAWLAEMTLEEKVAEMHGVGIAAIEGLFHAGGNERLGIPPFRMVDGPRGVRAGTATAFPVGMARGATWDPELERRVGEAIAMEAKAKGANVLLAPTMNLLRHPGWGRAQETYGEDSHHMAQMAAGFVRGAQQHLIATAKHYAANSIEDTRFEVDVSLDDRTLREVYLPHFRHVVMEAGVGAVMSAYNLVNGAYCAENAPLLQEILKGEWGFEGFVMSDWLFGTRSTVPSALAGLDVEMPGPAFYGEPLVEAVNAGELPLEVIDTGVHRILRTKAAFDVGTPAPFGDEVVASADHQALAREVATRSITLLRNEAEALPLDDVASLAVVGELAEVANMGDEGSSAVIPASSVSPLAGFEARDVAVTPIVVDAIGAADEAAIAAADAAVVVVGLTAEDEGENLGVSGGDRDSLALSPEQEALVLAVAAVQPRTIVVLEGGSAIVVEAWRDSVAGIVMAYYPGQEGGHALADVLFGDVSPSGRLPFSVPIDEAHLVPFDHVSDAVTYGYLHGYRHLDAQGNAPRYAFGHGLTYTTFSYDALTATGTPDAPQIEVSLTNTGSRAGEEVVQIYVGTAGSAVERAPRELVGFVRVALEPGESTTVDVPIRDLAIYDGAAWTVEAVDYTFFAGGSAADLPLTAEL